MAKRRRIEADFESSLAEWEAGGDTDNPYVVWNCPTCKQYPDLLPFIREYMQWKIERRITDPIEDFYYHYCVPGLWIQDKEERKRRGGYKISEANLRKHMKRCERELYIKGFKKGRRQ